MYRVKACWVRARRLWQRREQLDAGGEVADGFQMGRAVAGLLARPLPVDHRLLGAARGSVVVRHQLWLRLHGSGETRFQDLGNRWWICWRVLFSSDCIGCILDQGVLEQIRGLRRRPRWYRSSASTNCCSPCCKVSSSREATACSRS